MEPTNVLPDGDVGLRNHFARAFFARAKRNAEEDQVLDAVLFDDEEISDIKKARTRRRPGGSNKKGRNKYKDSVWARMLQDNADELATPGSEAAKTFRSRFRVPYPIFLKLLEMTNEWHDETKSDAAGRASIPTALKLLGVLRILGRATCFDGILELSGISVSTMQRFFHEFTAWFRKEVYPKFVSTPTTLSELMDIQAAYAALGLPGAIGSMDVVHLAWCMCPAFLANLATGKEGYPSIAYNVICDHQGRALAVLTGAYGSTNDKTIVRFDDFVDDVRCDVFFRDFQYEVRTGPEPHDRKMECGAWLIIDGGYHKWPETQAASKVCSLPSYAEWRTQMESVRKDIECFFGRLKARFRILKTPITFHKKSNIDDLFFTCVGLQNMLLDWDIEVGVRTSWEVEPEFGLFQNEEDGDNGEGRLWSRPRLRRYGGTKETFVAQATDDFSDFGCASFPIGAAREIGRTQPGTGETARYHEKQAKLVEHFKQMRASDANRPMWLLS